MKKLNLEVGQKVFLQPLSNAAPDTWTRHEDGVYPFRNGFRRCEGGVWYRLCATIAESKSTSVQSIHQTFEF